MSVYDKPIRAYSPKMVAPKLSLEDNVERSGYVPLSEQVRLAQQSGVLLRTQRMMQYDVKGDMLDDDNFDRYFNRLTAAYDLVDVDNLRVKAKSIQDAYKIASAKVAESKKSDSDQSPVVDSTVQVSDTSAVDKS